MTAPIRCTVVVDKDGRFAMGYVFSGDPARYDRETLTDWENAQGVL